MSFFFKQTLNLRKCVIIKEFSDAHSLTWDSLSVFLFSKIILRCSIDKLQR